jgi:hypothetical protein
MRGTMEKIDMLQIKSKSRFVYEDKLEVKHQGVSNITINQKEVSVGVLDWQPTKGSTRGR